MKETQDCLCESVRAERVALLFPERVCLVVVLEHKTEDFADSPGTERVLRFLHKRGGCTLAALSRTHAQMVHDSTPPVMPA